MSEQPAVAGTVAPTEAVLRRLAAAHNESERADLLFLEQWERWPMPGLAATMRANQIRRANPDLVAEIRAELRMGRPLTATERALLPH